MWSGVALEPERGVWVSVVLGRPPRRDGSVPTHLVFYLARGLSWCRPGDNSRPRRGRLISPRLNSNKSGSYSFSLPEVKIVSAPSQGCTPAGERSVPQLGNRASPNWGTCGTPIGVHCALGAAAYFIEGRTMPRMMTRWQRRKTAAVGMETRTKPAMTTHGVPAKLRLIW